MAGSPHESDIDGVNGFIDRGSSSPVVLKFGGTSIGKFLPEIVKIISLLRAYREAAQQNINEYQEICSSLEKEHYEAGECIISHAIKDRYFQAVKLEFLALESHLSSIAQLATTDHILEDAVVSAGEKLSCQLLDAVLTDNGIQSSYIDFSNVINFSVPFPLARTFYQDLAGSIGSRLSSLPPGNVLVITGFFGHVPGGLVNCLCYSLIISINSQLMCSPAISRGYSDLCAALVAVGLRARELQVWKEVDGVFTADPRYVPTARLLSSITPEEVNELTYYGSEVIHQFTVEHCVPTIPIRIKNVLHPENEGTIIQTGSQGPRDGRVGNDNLGYGLMKPKRPTAVTVKRSITVVNIHSNRKGIVIRIRRLRPNNFQRISFPGMKHADLKFLFQVESPEFLAKICLILAKHAMFVDLFEKSETRVSLAIHSQAPFVSSGNDDGESRYETEHTDLAKAIRELEELGQVDVVHGLAILSLIGTGLKRSTGIAGKLFCALGDNAINIDMISQGVSTSKSLNGDC
ncbi:MAG: hypothetical protein Q9214_003458 [Letrouitia sp. 1 TL-2023]